MSADLPSDMSSQPLHPEITWAQRSSSDDAEKNFIWITLLVSDVPASSMKLDLQPTSLKFDGYSNSKKVNYSVALEFYSEIDPAASKVHHTERALELKLQKKELNEEFWPRLLKDKQKVHFLRTDFDKWVDEDEQDAVPEDDYMNQFGGGGMPGMGMGGDGGFGGLDFSKLGGGAGLGDLGGEGEEEMPDLDDEDAEDVDADEDINATASGSGTNSEPKIKEVE